MTKPVTLLVGVQYKAGDVLEFRGDLYTAKEDSTYIDAATQRFAEEVNDQHLMTGWHTNVREATRDEAEAYKSKQERKAQEKAQSINTANAAFPIGSLVFVRTMKKSGMVEKHNDKVAGNVLVRFENGKGDWLPTKILQVQE